MVRGLISGLIWTAKWHNSVIVVLFQAVAYFISVLDKIVNRDYVIVYLHTLSSEENQPPLSFLKDIYHLVDNKLVLLSSAVTLKRPGVHQKAVFRPLNLGLMRISRSRFKQSRNSLLISQIYVLR